VLLCDDTEIGDELEMRHKSLIWCAKCPVAEARQLGGKAANGETHYGRQGLWSRCELKRNRCDAGDMSTEVTENSSGYVPCVSVRHEGGEVAETASLH